MSVTVISDAVGVTAEDFGFGNLPAGIGNKPLLLITWQFPLPSKPIAPNDFYDQLIFNFLNFPSVNGYYLENSHGHFLWTRAGTIGPVLLDASEAAALRATQSDDGDGTMRFGIDCGAGIAFLLQLAAAKTGYNFAQWDRNGDGVVDNSELFIMLVGNAGDLFGGNRPIGAASSGQVVPGQSVTLRGSVAGLDHQTSLTTFAHEAGHSLGTQDLYGPKQDLNQGLTLMSGTFESGVDGRRTFHLDPWHKLRLGWLRPRIFPMSPGGVATVTTAQLAPALPPVILFDPSRGTSEYFIVEYRNSNPTNGGASYDANIPQPSGLAVWHVVPGSDPPAFHEGSPGLSKGGNALWTGRTPPLRWNDGTLSSTRLNLLSIAADGSEMVFEWTN
jgi:M6 family metalloprotease-like protein